LQEHFFNSGGNGPANPANPLQLCYELQTSAIFGQPRLTSPLPKRRLICEGK
jgi:hypothetical protein